MQSRGTEVIRTLNERERRDLTPFVEEYLEARARYEELEARLGAVLRLTEPAYAEPGVTFDPRAMCFTREARPEPAPDSADE